MQVDTSGRIEELIRLLYAQSADHPDGLRQLRSYMFRLIAGLPSEQVATTGRASRLPVQAASALTPRECDVLRLMSCGLPNKGIAGELQIASETVKAHIKSIFSKLAVRTRIHAVSRGSALGLI